MKRRSVAFYIRLSEADEEVRIGEKCESNSITVQRELLNSYISKSEEYRDADVHEYFDDGYTGTKFSSRKNFQRMLEDAGKGMFECILVKDFSRLGRDYIEVGNYMELVFPTMGIRFISVNDGYDSSKMQGMTGGMDVAFKNLIHQMYSRDMSKKCKSARKIRNINGEYTASYAPYGYKRDPEDKHKLVIDQEAASVIREIYDKYLAGIKVADIVKDLNRRKVPTRLITQQRKSRYKSSNYLGDGLWDYAAVYYILSHEIYKGTLIQNKWGSVGAGDDKRQVKNDRSKWTIVDGIVPPIISEEKFEQVRDKMSRHPQNRRKGYRVKGGNIFRCGYCGRSLAKGSKGKLFYCTMRNLGGDERCRLSKIRVHEVQEMVLSIVKEHIDMLTKKAEALRIQSSSALPCESREDLITAKEVLENSSINLYKEYKAGGISKADYDGKRLSIREQIRELETRIEEYEDNQAVVEEEAILESLPIIGDEYDPDIMGQLIEKVEIFSADRINVVFKCADPYSGQG